MAVILEKRNLRGLIIDSTVSESHSKSARVTSNPVSVDGQVSDHMTYDNTKITLRGLIGDSAPSRYRGGAEEPRVGKFDMPILEFSAGNGDDSLSETSSSLILSAGYTHFGSKLSSFSPDVYGERTSAAWCRILELIENKEVCELVTGLKVYDSVVVTSATTEQNKDNLDKLDFTITLEQIKRVRAQEDTIQQIQGKGAVNRGDVSASKCLRLNEVFSNNANSSNTVTKITKSNGQVVPNFNIAVYNDAICGAIGKRYLSLIKSNRLETLPSNPSKRSINLVSPALINGLSFVGIVDLSDELSPPSTTTPAANQDDSVSFETDCLKLLIDSDKGDYGTFCRLTEFCGDSRFEEQSDEGEESASTENTVNSNAVDNASSAELTTGLIAKRTLSGPEIVKADAQSQLRIDNEIGLKRAEEEVERLNCYYKRIINDLASADTESGRALRSVGYPVDYSLFPDSGSASHPFLIVN